MELGVAELAERLRKLEAGQEEVEKIGAEILRRLREAETRIQELERRPQSALSIQRDHISP